MSVDKDRKPGPAVKATFEREVGGKMGIYLGGSLFGSFDNYNLFRWPRRDLSPSTFGASFLDLAKFISGTSFSDLRNSGYCAVMTKRTFNTEKKLKYAYTTSELEEFLADERDSLSGELNVHYALHKKNSEGLPGFSLFHLDAIFHQFDPGTRLSLQTDREYWQPALIDWIQEHHMRAEEFAKLGDIDSEEIAERIREQFQ